MYQGPFRREFRRPQAAEYNSVFFSGSAAEKNTSRPKRADFSVRNRGPFGVQLLKWEKRDAFTI